VDVREASAHQRLRAYDPAAAELTQSYGKPENREPLWPLEREMPSGKRLNAANSDTAKLKKKKIAVQRATQIARTSHAKKPEIPYVPAKAPLVPMKVSGRIVAHVSPDAGLETLEEFLAGTTKSLTIGMYDFTSGRILASIEKALAMPGPC